MSLKIQQNLNQNLRISHKMQQALSVLSLSHDDLKTAIEKELLENPLLEAVEPDSFHHPSKHIQRAHRHLHNSLESYYEKKNKNSKSSFEDFLTESPSLKSFVLNQVKMSFFSKKIKLVLPLLISYLDDRGYLNLDFKELSSQEQISLSLLKATLKALQSLEPLGLGGRDLKECLLIQLQHRKENTRTATLIIQNHLQNIKDKKYKAIAYDLNISLEELKTGFKIIQSLEPNPGRSFSSQPTVFVRPDLYIYKDNETYSVFLNNEELPHLKLSYEYTKYIKKKLSSEEKKYFQERKNSAHWFIQSLQQRQEKIKRLAHCLISRQKDFFEKGASHLKPLTMQEIATEMGVHVSTISRTVNNKYAYTNQGVISLKTFFQKGLTTKKGEGISIPVIKKAIKKWIEEEDPQQPFSDKQLKDKLYETFYISLLRRSVSQYRVSMGIPSLTVRKWNFLNSQSLSSSL